MHSKRNSKNLFNKRIDRRYENGQFVFFEKAGSINSHHAIPLKTPEQLQPVIIRLFLETALKCQNQGIITDRDLIKFQKLMTKLEKPNSSLQNVLKSVFLREKEDGGSTRKVYKQYFGVSLNFKPLFTTSLDPRNPKALLVKLIQNLRKKDASYGKRILNSNDKRQAHAFVLDPNLFQDAINSKMSAKQWLEANQEKPVLFADTNWGDFGEKAYFAVKRDRPTNLRKKIINWINSPYQLVVVNSQGEILPSLNNVGRQFEGNRFDIAATTGVEDAIQREKELGFLSSLV